MSPLSHLLACDIICLMERAYAKGFTIVELLIVIVVIGILAALSVAAYVNISDRAHGSSVMSDLSGIGKKIAVDMVDNGVAPEPNTSSFRGIGVQVSKQSYSKENYLSGGAGPYNLLYCTTSDRSQYGLVAWAKGGDSYVYKDGHVKEYAGEFDSRLVICGSIGLGVTGNDSQWLMTGNSWYI